MTNRYVLGTDDDELARLGAQHQVWAPQITALWQRAGLRNGMKIFDAGCGPGFASIDLARLVGPLGHIVAADESSRYVEHLNITSRALGITNIETIAADLADMPLPSKHFDAVFLRWVLCFVKDPAHIVMRLADALRPGGKLIAVDYFNYRGARVIPGGETFTALFRAFEETNRAAGGDYDVGDRFAAMACDAGLRVEHVAPICHIARPGGRFWDWFVTFCRVYVPRLVEGGNFAPEQAEAVFDALAQHEADPGAFVFTPPVVEMIAARPPDDG